jgi:multimeric flavodoxin WrbA
MKMTVISYSLTGNNESLAKSLAGALAAEHVSITEPKRRSMGTIAFDMMFKRTPKVNVPAVKPEERDLVVFVGPVWMGQVASPFRACLKQLGPKLGKYAFVSICGGADGPNPKLAAELTRRLGKEPAALVEMHKADLLPPEPKPTRNDTMAYKVGEAQVRQLTEKAVSALKAIADRASR